MKTYEKCSDVNAIIDEKTALKDGVLVNPELGIEASASSLLLDFIKLGMKKALSQDTAGKVSPAKIQEVIQCWQAGYALLTIKKEAEKPVIVKSGKPAKLQFTQLQVSAALRDLNGPDDAFATFFASLDDDQFQVIMDSLEDMDASESKLVKDALAKLQSDSLAELEAKAEKEKADKLAQARALMAKARQG